MADKPKHNGPYTITSSEIKYQNRWITVREDAVVHPEGSTGIFGVVDCRPGVIIVALNDKYEVSIIHEYRYAYQGESIELPAGGIEDGQSPLAAAERELREEAGLLGEKWTSLGHIEPLTTVVSSPAEAFLASGLTKVETEHEESEVIKEEFIPLAEAYKMAMDGRIFFAPAIVALVRAVDHLERTSSFRLERA